MAIKPMLEIIEGESNDLTPYLGSPESFVLQDIAGMTGDIIDITIADDGSVSAPAKGANLSISFGYQGDMIQFGVFVVSGITYAGGSGGNRITISATSIPLNTDTGFGTLKSFRYRTWKDTTVKRIVDQIALANNLLSGVQDNFDSFPVDHLNQSAESDISFLTQLARTYDATMKIGNGTILFVKASAGETANGSILPVNTIDISQVSNYSFSDVTASSVKSYKAKWINKATHQRGEVMVGNGEPVHILALTRESEEVARQYATSFLNRQQRKRFKASLTIPGNPRLVSESKIKLTGFREEFNQEMTIKSITHVFNSNGYTSKMDAER